MIRPTTKFIGAAVVVSVVVGLIGADRHLGRAATASTVPFERSVRALRSVTPTAARAAASTTYDDVFAFGDAAPYGSTGTLTLERPIVGMAATPSGNGYWEVASDGGIFAFGDAGFLGSTGAVSLNRPIVGMAATPSGNGYWLVASDGGIFAFGDAAFDGSLAGTDLASGGKFATGIAATGAGAGYWIVATRLDRRPIAVAAPAPAAPHASSSGSFSSVIYDSQATGHFEIYRRDLRTNAVTQLTNDPRYDSWWARASPGGTRMLFYRTPAGVHDTDYLKTSLWTANIDGSGLRQLIANGQHGWTVQGHAEWSPDGTQLVMFGGAMGIVVTDTDGTILHRVTNGIDPVWSADGKQILYINCVRATDYPSCPHDQARVYAVNVDGSSPHILVDVPGQANDPTMSPDGSMVAWEAHAGGAVWNLWVANADGSNPHVLLSDGNINSNPVWASDDELVFYKTAPLFHAGFGVWTIRRDGSGLTWLTPGQAGMAEMAFPLQ